jgi:hypothetical protein
LGKAPLRLSVPESRISVGEILILDKGGYSYTFVGTEEMRSCLKHFGKGAAALIRS